MRIEDLYYDTIYKYGKPKKIYPHPRGLPCVYLYYNEDFIIRLCCW